MIKLVVFDIDGTLIPLETHQIAPETINAIAELKRRGIYTAIASGRQLTTMQPEIRDIGFDYFICSNGSYITNAAGEVLKYHNIDQATVDELTQDFIAMNEPLAMRYITGSKHANPNRSIFEYSKHFFSAEQLDKLMEDARRQEQQDYTGQLPIAFVGHVSAEQKAELEQKYPQLVFMLTAKGLLCDINRAGVGKETGILDICDYLNIDIEETMAFGDDGNDVGFIRTAGIGVAMGNAIPEVKAVANYLTDDCMALGVVKALKYFALID